MFSKVNQNRAWEPSKLQRRVDEAARQIADEEAARIPWPQLLKARRSYVEWQTFLLWARAIEEAERRLPEWLAHVVKKRCPCFEQFLLQQRTKERRWPQPAWFFLERWINQHVFAKPRHESWMNAVGYYAVRDLAALRNDAYWYYCERQWKQSKPAVYPSFQEWRQASEHCSDEVFDHFETTNKLRYVIRLSRRVSPPTLNETVDRYVEWLVFAYWVHTALDREDRLPDSVKRELEWRCPGFLKTAAMPDGSVGTEAEVYFDRLLRWVEEQKFTCPRTEGWWPVLIYQAHLHPRHQRLLDVWNHHRRIRSNHQRYPSFEQWTAFVDTYTFEPEDGCLTLTSVGFPMATRGNEERQEPDSNCCRSRQPSRAAEEDRELKKSRPEAVKRQGHN
jgi:hypothetical protein